MENKQKIINRLKYSILIFCSIIQIFPLIWLILLSFKSSEEILTKNTLILPEKFLYQNYVLAWTEGKISRYFFNSILVSMVSIIATLLLSSMIAYAITRMKWKLSNLTLFIFMTGMTVPIHSILISLFIMLKRLNLLPTYFSVILPYIVFSLPLGIFVFSNFMRQIPYELEEAAFIDGASVFRVFFNIFIPILKPAFAIVGIATFLFTWNEFIMAATFISKQEMKTIPVGIMVFRGEWMVHWGPIAASIVISSIPILIFYIFLSDFVEKTFTAGAIVK